MNERIKEIERQCWQSTDSEPYALFDVKKFAELIVKETLQVARAGIEFSDGMEDAVYTYFGVEE